jgi:diguanylate cyclase (GGDEF)-like protein
MSAVIFPRRALALLLLLPLAVCAAAATMRGQPLMQRYTSEDYPSAPSHLSVTSDDGGAIYVGNFEGVLRYRGGEWENFELPGLSPARALHNGWDGRIYVGGYDQFGAIETADTGEMRYHDLRPQFGLSGADANVGDVWSVLETSRGLYFRASRRLFFLGRDGSTRQWPLEPEVRGFNVVGEALYARVKGVGITRFEDGRLVPIPGADVFADRTLVLVEARGDGLLLGSEDGFFEADAQGIRRLPSVADSEFANNPPYAGLALPDGTLVFGSFDGVLTRFSPTLQLLDRVPLGAYTISAFGTDREGGLWAATEGDLVRLKLPSPWTAYTEVHGLVGSLADSAWYDDTLWVATSVDVLRAQADVGGQPRFEPQGWTTLEAFDLEATPQGLLVAEREGVLALDPGQTQPRRVAAAEAVYLIERSSGDAQHAYALAEREVLWMTVIDGRWQVATRWPLDGLNPAGLYETAPGELWLSNLRGAPERWRFDTASGELLERTPFGPAAGLDPDPLRGTILYQLDDRLYAVSKQAGHVFDGTRFVPSDLGPLKVFDRPMETAVAQTPLGTYAWTSRQLLHRRPDATDFKPVRLASRLARGFSQVQVHDDGMLRANVWKGLLQFDPSIPETPEVPLVTSLERFELRLRDATPIAQPLVPQGARVLPPEPGLSFRFGLTTMEPDIEFRYRMLGHTDAWSEWRGERDLLYRSLAPGEYQLEVQARTRSGRLAKTLRYPLQVQPYWYQTPLAWAAGTLLVMLAVAAATQLIVRLRYQQFVATKRRLEKRISERTAELEAANRKLAELATEDSLTGVPNRRALEQALAREWQRCGELQQPLALIMVDVDHFKQFNDRHGHLEGDNQLRWVAQQLAQGVRPVRELLARFGGEEFALVLPGLHLDEAVARAERLRQRFSRGDSPLTVSLGVAAQLPHPEGDPSDLLRRADTALYRAKRRGRNRVEAADD